MSLIKDFSAPLGIPLANPHLFYRMAMQYVKKDFSWAEFGTFKGITARIFLQFLPKDKNLYLFDSFKGLPEEWADSKRDEVSPIGTFARNPPNFDDSRAILQVGWFDDTVPLFVKDYKERGFSFIHIDCDLYSSTKTVLNGIKKLILPETVIIFDELCGVLRHQEHEYRAYEEFVIENNLKAEYICSEKNNTRVAVRLKNAFD
tara:strand:- start:248 stop:856 length:609 start_codon:yes stop_codon:yes gene_type:complete